MNDTLHELPTLRAQVGSVLKHATVHRGEWDPSTVFWLLERNGAVDYDDAPDALDTIEDTMVHNSEVSYDGS